MNIQTLILIKTLNKKNLIKLYVNQNIQYVEPSNQLLDNDLSSQLVIGERVFHIKFGYEYV